MLTPLSLSQLSAKWNENKENYKTIEIGSGVHSFVCDALNCEELFKLKEVSKLNKDNNIFNHDNTTGENGRPDFVIKINENIIIPVEVKCYTRIEEGKEQIIRYQNDYSKKYGILTDGWEWRFYSNGNYKRLYFNEFENNFATFWKEWIKPESYYKNVFQQDNLFHEPLKLDNNDNKRVFFDEITDLISNFRTKIKTINLFFSEKTEKECVEITYSYIIQFILYKVVVDNNFGKLKTKYEENKKSIYNNLQSEDYNSIMSIIEKMCLAISKKIYIPFEKEQEEITKNLFDKIDKPTLDTISPWLDILGFIDKYNFANLQNEVFGFIYENFLKVLYQKEDKGQFFTPPEIVNLMLDEVGFNEEYVKNNPDKISVIDPACGAGTFLYSATDRIIKALNTNNTEEQSKDIEDKIDKNIFGFDVEEFPLYLAEMNILMRLLPLVLNDKFNNPIDNKFKLFKTKDSISEFLEIGLTNERKKIIDLFSILDKTALDYPSFMRVNNDLVELFNSMVENPNRKRDRFDFVIANPPYIGYNACCKAGMEFTKKIKNKDDSINLGNVYGVNLHSIPNNRKKYAPKPNLYAFFIALGLALLKKNGKMCYIIPQTILSNGDNDVLRYHLSNFTTIEKLITFEDNVFVGRGTKQNQAVATSSLIFVVKKAEPPKDHKVKIITYKANSNSDNKGFELADTTQKEIPQQEFIDNVENWSFIKFTDDDRKFIETYKQNSEDISCYYQHDIAEKRFGDRFWFDGNINVENKKIMDLEKENCFFIPKTEKKHLLIKKYRFYEKNNKLKIAQGSQNYQDVCKTQYKIIWRYTNFNEFYFCNKKDVLVNYGYYCISSNNKQEILFLISLLNTKIVDKIINLNLKFDEEKSLLVGLKDIKKYIRSPLINTPEKQQMKDKVIDLTDKMLALEEVKLKDIVNFDNVLVQKFSKVFVENGKLILEFDNDKLKLDIPADKVELVKKSIELAKLFGSQEISLLELKEMETIDFGLRDQLKSQIDNIVAKMYGFSNTSC